MASLSLLTLLIINLALTLQAQVIYEDGYTVSTVLDGHKLNINPYSVSAQSGSSKLMVLDHFNSLFLTLRLPFSQNTEVKRFSGNGSYGYCDGENGESVMFNKPKSFAVDLKGNVYVAHKDKNRRTIRKISGSGVVTIAGGYSEKPGRVDGPAQSASFSDDFELAFVPEICALLISDRGNQLIRQIDLRPDDCRPQSSKSVGAVSVWVFGIGVGLSCLISFIAGFFVRLYAIPCEGSSEHATHETWKKCQISLVNQVLTLCSVIRSVIVSLKFKALPMKLVRMSLSHLSLMFGVNILKKKRQWEEPVSLLDSDVSSSYKIPKPLTYDEQLKDLLTFSETPELSNLAHAVDAQLITGGETNYGFSGISGKLESMMQVSLMDFAGDVETSSSIDSFVGSPGVIKKK